MQLWIRYREARQLEWDQRLEIQSENDWRNAVHDPSVISTILWPEPPHFFIECDTFVRKHPHEKRYRHHTPRNLAYRDGARRLAEQLDTALAGRTLLLYAPLRGAWPIWQTIKPFLSRVSITPYFPVTSSFVFYPEAFRVKNAKGRTASGRFNNILELRRLSPFLGRFDGLLYLDEIVSGNMMWGHVQDMLKLGIHQRLPIYAAGLADAHGERSVFKRSRLASLVEQGLLANFFWSGCESLITEDQKFLLGMHYADYHSGLNVIPVLTRDLKFYPEKAQFDEEVFTGLRGV